MKSTYLGKSCGSLPAADGDAVLVCGSTTITTLQKMKDSNDELLLDIG